MSRIISDVKDFYFYYHTFAEIRPESTGELVTTTSLCKRTDFVSAAFDALTFLVYNVGLTVFSALALVATVGLIPYFKASFCKNAYEGMVHAGSIPISLVGIISPKTVNENFLNLPSLELKTEAPDTLSQIAGLVGGMVIRQRLPYRLCN